MEGLGKALAPAIADAYWNEDGHAAGEIGTCNFTDNRDIATFM
jgi:hypothetical protein